MKAIILAAGRGSRLKRGAADRPKTLAELAGRPLFSWILAALAEAGAGPLAVVGGYRLESLAEFQITSPVPFELLENQRWAETNMLASLSRAAAWAAGQECLISYADIVYPARHVRALMADPRPIALTYDPDWEKLWRLRHGEAFLDDAETFRAEGGLLKEIGARARRPEEARGQYMGLLKLTLEGWRLWLEGVEALGPAADKTDMTGFLSRLLASGAAIGAVATAGAWVEADSDRDLELYEEALRQGGFSHDWRA